MQGSASLIYAPRLPYKEMEKRENTIRKNISNAWVFLQERGVIKKLEPASLGKNAGFLLMLGDEEENLAVELWARQCLGLPMSR